VIVRVRIRANTEFRVPYREVFRIGTVRYNWPMSAHASQAFSIAHCTDSEDLQPYSQRYLFNTIPDTNHNANLTNPNHNGNGNPNRTNPTNPTNPNTRYCCEYGILNSMFTWIKVEITVLNNCHCKFNCSL